MFPETSRQTACVLVSLGITHIMIMLFWQPEQVSTVVAITVGLSALAAASCVVIPKLPRMIESLILKLYLWLKEKPLSKETTERLLEELDNLSESESEDPDNWIDEKAN